MKSNKRFKFEQNSLLAVAIICLIIAIIIGYHLWIDQFTTLLKGLIIWVALPFSFLLNLVFIVYFLYAPRESDETPEEKREAAKYHRWSE